MSEQTAKVEQVNFDVTKTAKRDFYYVYKNCCVAQYEKAKTNFQRILL